MQNPHTARTNDAQHGRRRSFRIPGTRIQFRGSIVHTSSSRLLPILKTHLLHAIELFVCRTCCGLLCCRLRHRRHSRSWRFSAFSFFFGLDLVKLCSGIDMRPWQQRHATEFAIFVLRHRLPAGPSTNQNQRLAVSTVRNSQL